MPNHERIQYYRIQDALDNLKVVIYINLFLLICLLVPHSPALVVNVHALVLLSQIGLLAAFLYTGAMRSRGMICVLFALLLLTTLPDVYVWISQLDGIIRGALRGSKGAPFAFVFESPPYFYPIIRIGSLLLFWPIFSTFGLAWWTGPRA